MAATLGTVREFELAELARHLAPRQQVSVFVIETRGGWHTMAYHDGHLVWKSDTGLREDDRVLTVFGMSSGKFAFQRSECSSPDGLSNALELLKKGRHAVYQAPPS